MGNSASDTAETQWHASSTAQRVAILELSNTEDTFLVPPQGADSTRASHLEDYHADITALRRADPQLCRMHVALVTGGAPRISGQQFWSSYLAHVARVRRSEEFAATGLGDAKAGKVTLASAASPIPIHSPAVPGIGGSPIGGDMSAVNFSMEDFDAAETDATADATLASFLSSSDDDGDETITESRTEVVGASARGHAPERNLARDWPGTGGAVRSSGQRPDETDNVQVAGGRGTCTAGVGSTSSAKDNSSTGLSGAPPSVTPVPNASRQNAAEAAGGAAVVAAAAAAEANHMIARATLAVARARLVATAALVQQSAPPASVVGCACHALPNAAFLRAKSRVVALASDVQSAHAAEAAAASASSSWASVGRVKTFRAEVMVESMPPIKDKTQTVIATELVQAKARARALKQAGRLGEAVNVMREATKAHARALKNAGRVDEAIAVMRAAKARENVAMNSKPSEGVNEEDADNSRAAAEGFSVWRVLGLT